MPGFARYEMTIPGAGEGAAAAKFYFIAPEGSYAGIEAKCGVKEIAKDEPEYRYPACSVEEMVKSTVCSRRRLRLNDAAGNKVRYKDVLVAANLVEEFPRAIAGETTNGRMVLYSYEPSKNKTRA